jgi:hypothetical protein
VSAASGKMSRSSLKAFLAQDDDADAELEVADPRATDLRSLGAEDPDAIAAIRDVFAGTDLPNNEAKVRRILRARNEIQKEWSDARDSFLAIGRVLVALESELTRVEFARLRQSTTRLFPFSDATATQLRQIARAVDSGRIPSDSCPGSYGTAYQIALLTDRQMRIAHERGLIRANVTRREIMDLRREVSVVDIDEEQPARVDKARLREERARLSERRGRVAAELAAIEHRLARLDELLSPIAGEDDAAQPSPEDELPRHPGGGGQPR